MAKKGEQRIKVGLLCKVCNSQNYITERNKVNRPEKLVLRKYCKKCKKVTEHKETTSLGKNK